MTLRAAARAHAGGTVQAIARESLPAVVFSAFLFLLAALVPDALGADGWLALVSGRLIATSGIPHHDTLAALTAGRDWVDQQWLGQLAAYGLEVAGGIRLLLVINVTLVAAAFAAAMVYARRRGAHPNTVAVVGLLALLPFLVTGMNVRTQSFTYLPFVGVVALLARPRLLTARAVVAVLALLVIWANVHGSALLAAAVLALRGAVDVSRTPRSRRGWLLVVAPWLCLLVSPYHIHLVSYYWRTAFNPSFSAYLSQWAPTTFSPVAAPLLVLLFATAWMVGRSSGIYSAYERWLLGAAVLLGLLAVRNWAFVSLLLLTITPVGFDRSLRKRAPGRAPAIGAAIGTVAALAALVVLGRALSAPTSDLVRSYPPAAADAAGRVAAAHPRGVVYAGIPFADWLLWSRPELAGRVAFDVRYELLHRAEIRRIVLFDTGSRLDRPLGHPIAYVLDPDLERHPLDSLPNIRTVYHTDEAVVAVERHVG